MHKRPVRTQRKWNLREKKGNKFRETLLNKVHKSHVNIRQWKRVAEEEEKVQMKAYG